MRSPCGGRTGSVLVFALVAVLVATLLAVGLSAWLRPRLALAAARRGFRADALACHACIDRFAEDVLLCDSNGVDDASEAWHRPFRCDELPGAAIVAEFPAPEAASGGADDEESRWPLNLDLDGPLEELAFLVSGQPRDLCRRVAAELAAMRPLRRREEMRLAPSMTPPLYDALAPYVTAAPVQGVNLNTAPGPVLKALLSFAGKHDASAALTLSSKILAFREGGGVFPSPDAPAVRAAIGGLSPAEGLLVSACAGRAAVQSRLFSGAAVCGRARVVFTYDRGARRLARVVEAAAP